MMKLKIGILGTRGIPNRYGGFEEFAQYLSKGLALKGYEVYVYSPHSHPYQLNEWEGVHIIHCKDPGPLVGGIGQFLYDLRCNNDARRRKFDVLLHLGYTTDSIWFWRWPKGTAHVVNIDGMEWKRAKHGTTVRLFLKWAEALAARHAQVLVADSIPMQQYFIDRYRVPAIHMSYGTRVFTSPEPSVLNQYGVSGSNYFLLVARMEPENNIEMILQGYLQSNRRCPIMVVGNHTAYGKQLQQRFNNSGILFPGPVYDRTTLDNLRFHCTAYFHGHSVGGTNPSLLEAMACSCAIAAHDNPFNRAVLASDADYFKDATDVAALIDKPRDVQLLASRLQQNIAKINSRFSEQQNINDYEQLFVDVYNRNKKNHTFTNT